jgi:hypothetical protein
VFSLGYNAWTALFLSSGDRFLIPIDWTWHLYYALGLLTIIKILLSGIHDLSWFPLYDGAQDTVVAKTFNWKKIVITAGLVLCIGTLLPLTELAFPEKYPALTQAQLSAALGITPQKGEIIVYGRAIYPRYYNAGEGEPASAKLGYGVSAEARLVFSVVGPKPGLVIFPLEAAPGFFPNASDVWIIGSQDGDVLRARIIKVADNKKSVTYGQ